MENDAQLIQRFRSGDESAFEELVRKYQDRVANVIYSFTGRTDEVEDLAQEVFLRAYVGLKDFKSESTFYSWLYRIVMNVCIDAGRKRKLRRMLSLEGLSEWALERLRFKSPSQLPSPEEGAEQVEISELIQRGLNRLSEPHRAILILRDIEGLSYEEIAGILNCSVGTVKSRLFRARSALKEELRPYWEEKV